MNTDTKKGRYLNHYEVEYICGMRLRKKRAKEYLIKWKDYPHSQNTWQPLKNLNKIRKMIQEYDKSILLTLKPQIEPSINKIVDNQLSQASLLESRFYSSRSQMEETQTHILLHRIRGSGSINTKQTQYNIELQQEPSSIPHNQQNNNIIDIISITQRISDSQFLVQHTNGNKQQITVQELKARCPLQLIDFLLASQQQMKPKTPLFEDSQQSIEAIDQIPLPEEWLI